MVLRLRLVQSYVGMVRVIIISVFPQKKSGSKGKSSTVTPAQDAAEVGIYNASWVRVLLVCFHKRRVVASLERYM